MKSVGRVQVLWGDINVGLYHKLKFVSGERIIEAKKSDGIIQAMAKICW